jgi:hypothetical protein
VQIKKKYYVRSAEIAYLGRGIDAVSAFNSPNLKRRNVHRLSKFAASARQSATKLRNSRSETTTSAAGAPSRLIPARYVKMSHTREIEC